VSMIIESTWVQLNPNLFHPNKLNTKTSAPR
jgi:hypothetical protein